MEWDGVTLKAWAGIAAVIAGVVLLLVGVGLVVPMMGVGAGVAAMLGADG
jgi:drug/metabolite transporter (DMT)-like permease